MANITRLTSTEPKLVPIRGLRGTFRVWQAEKSPELQRAVSILGVNHPYDMAIDDADSFDMDDLFEMRKLAIARSGIYQVLYKELFSTPEVQFQEDKEDPSSKRYVTKLCVGAAGVLGFANDVVDACFEVSDVFPNPDIVHSLSDQFFDGKYVSLFSPPVSIG